MKRFFSCLLVALSLAVAPARAQVVLNEIHYHPVEKAVFDAVGVPFLDLSDDVHEFVELRNAGAADVNVGGWKLSGDVDYTFPAGTTLAAGGYAVVAKNVARLQTVYGITGVLGPYSGKLSNSGSTLNLLNAGLATVDSVSYSPSFPWAISADALGAGDDFTGFDSVNYQYKGRSLQRVSATAASNDPANWIAVRPAGPGVTFADLPTPGAANLVTRTLPKPVVVARQALQSTNNSPTILLNVPVRVTCTFSSTDSLSNVQLEYFVDNMNGFGETRTSIAMTSLGNAQYSVTMPAGHAARTILRYRIKADRGDGLEVVSPRADDPAVVQVGGPTFSGVPLKKIAAAREAWYGWFVTPTRTSARPIIDVIVPTDNTAVDDTTTLNVTPFNGINGFQSMAFDSNGSPKRTTAADTASSYPREVPYVAANDRMWNNGVPAVFASNGVLYDILIRFHGSRWNRRPSRKSFKVAFADFQPYKDVAGNLVTSIFETDKTDFFLTAHGLNQLAGLPLSSVRPVDWYFNNDGLIQRVEQGEYNGELLDAYHEKIQRLNPGSLKEASGEYYKSVGYLCANNLSGEGPYGHGNAWPLPASGFWSEYQRYDYTYTLQDHTWKGNAPIRDLIKGMWVARGDGTGTLTQTSPYSPNVAAVKTWLQANWDMDTELTSLAINNWMCPWDDTSQNHFLWRRASGKWVRLLWDFDGEYGTSGPSATSSIYVGEVGDTANNFRGPHFIKDSILKAYRTEFKQRLWFLNNTLFDPENLNYITFTTVAGAASNYLSFIDSQSGGFATARFNAVNSQVGLGVFYKPVRPTPAGPANGSAVLPGANFTTSTYSYKATLTKTNPVVTSPHASTKWEIRSISSTYDYPIYVNTSTTNLISLPIPFDKLTFGQTYYWRVTYFAADGHPSVTSAETSFSYGPTSTTAGTISLNEVMAVNRAAVLNGTTYPDYVEIKNNSAAVVDISSWALTNDEALPAKYLFPAGTTVPAGGYLVVWCDNEVTSPGLHAGFGLNGGGDRILLIQSGVVKDVVTFGPQVPDFAIGRLVDGTGSWTLNTPTPGATNTALSALGAVTTLKINEWMADPVKGSDWFELYNPDANPVALAGLYLSDAAGTPTLTQIPALSYIAGHGYTKFTADGTTVGFHHVNFSLKTGGESILLTNANGVTLIDSVVFGAQQLGVSTGRFPDGAAAPAGSPPAWTAFVGSESPGDSNFLQTPVLINEVLSASSAPLFDFIELYNPTANTVNIGGWWLSDDVRAPKKYQIPANTLMAAGTYKVFTEADFNPTPGIGTSFSLSSFGDDVVLSAVDSGGALTGYQGQFSFGAASDGVSFGRVPITGGTEVWPLSARSMGSLNAPPKVTPVIINEVMYHPLDLGALDNARDEFIELHNVTTSPVDLSGWKLRGDVDFIFPAGSTLLPGDYILVLGFNPATDAALLSGFKTAYGIGAATSLFGPFTPKLSNSVANIELAAPGTVVDGGIPFIRVDKVEYSQSLPWPASADGAGASLQRISRTVIGNESSNWSGATPTPGAVNNGQNPILDSDGDGMPDSFEILNGFNRFSAADALLDTDGDGQSNLQEYLAGTDPKNPADYLRADVTGAVGSYVIRFTAKANHGYTIQFKNELSDGAWQRLVDIASQASDHPEQRTDSTAVARRFYRVVTPTAP